jgi:hypothetical protein
MKNTSYHHKTAFKSSFRQILKQHASMCVDNTETLQEANCGEIGGRYRLPNQTLF